MIFPPNMIPLNPVEEAILDAYDRSHPMKEATAGEITCVRYVPPTYTPCGKVAVTFCLHNGDVCAFCAEHHYICGETLTREQAVQLLAKPI